MYIYMCGLPRQNQAKVRKKWSWLYHWAELMFPFHLVKKLNFYHNLIQSYAYLNFGYNQSSLNVIMEKKHFKV